MKAFFVQVLIIFFAIAFAILLETCLRKAVILVGCAYRKRKVLSVLRKGVVNLEITYLDARHVAALWGLDGDELLLVLQTLAHESLVQHERFGKAGRDRALTLLATHKGGVA